VSQKCKEYCKSKKDNKINDIIIKEKKLIAPLYAALSKSTNLERISELLYALEKLSAFSNVKFFSIFLGVGFHGLLLM